MKAIGLGGLFQSRTRELAFGHIDIRILQKMIEALRKNKDDPIVSRYRAHAMFLNALDMVDDAKRDMKVPAEYGDEARDTIGVRRGTRQTSFPLFIRRDSESHE